MASNRRISNSGSGIPMRSSGIPRPSSATDPSSSSAIPRPASRIASATTTNLPGPGPTPARGRTSIAPPVSHVPHTASSGPLGSYNRSDPSASASASASVSATPSASRLGYRTDSMRTPAGPAAYSGLAGRISVLSASTSAAPSGAAQSPPVSANSLGLGGIAPGTTPSSALSAKRSVSAAGISPNDAHLNGGSASKRAATIASRRLSADGTSPLLLQADLHPASTPRPESPAYELSILRANYDQQLLAESRKYKKLEEDFQAKCREVDRFNTERAELLSEWDREQESRKDKEQAWAREKTALEEETFRLRMLNADLSNQLSEVQTSTSTAAQELQAKSTALETQIAHAKADAEAARTESARLRDDLAATQAQVDDLENALDDEKRLRLEAHDEARLGGQEGLKIAEELNRQTTYVRKLEAEKAHLEAENTRLTQHASNTELLKEEKRSLEAKLRVLDELRTRLADAESTIRDRDAAAAEWDSVLRDAATVTNGADADANADGEDDQGIVAPPAQFDRRTLPAYLSALRSALATQTARARGLETSLEHLRTRNATLEEAQRDASSKERQVESDFAELRANLTRAKRTEARLEDEITRLKALLSSYEAEERNLGGAKYDAAHAERIAMLERELETSKADNSQLSAQLESAIAAAKGSQDAGALRTALDEREAKVVALQREMAALTRELEQLANENATLYTRVGRGEFDQTTTRCLTLADNPISQDLAIRKASLDALRAENAQLLSRLEELNAQLSQTTAAAAAAAPSIQDAAASGLVPQAVVDNLRASLESTEAQLRSAEKAHLRLRQVYSMKAAEFRDVVASLFGYRLKFMPNGKVRLSSVFRRELALVFRSDEGNVGEMRVAGHAGTAVESLREYWLREGVRQSVPCFLAALTLEMYEGCTMAVRRAAVEGEEDEEE